MKLDSPADVGKAQRIESVLHLKYLLYSGPLSAVMAFLEHWSHSPNLWWPEDRSWCVATDIDLPSSYIGCDARCLEALCDIRRWKPRPSTTMLRCTWLPTS